MASCLAYMYRALSLCKDSLAAGIDLFDRSGLIRPLDLIGAVSWQAAWRQDFIACAEYLVEKGYTTPETMSCEGRSAGGLLMGNVLNMRPDLFQVAVAVIRTIIAGVWVAFFQECQR